MHLASPFVLGGAGAFAAKTLNIPCVAIFQTDVAGFANNYKLKAMANVAWQWTRTLHNQCALTLAPRRDESGTRASLGRIERCP